MTIVITGATGKLGGQTVDALLRRGLAATDIVAAGRNAEKLAELAASKGVRTAQIDIDDAASLAAAFSGAERVFLVSVPGNPRRVEQQTNAINAAKAAGVQLLAYASFVQSGKDQDHADHFATEQVLGDSGVPFAVLRNGVYFSYFARHIPGWRDQGEVVGAAGEGRISAAAHADLADATATVLTTPGHEGKVYELGIDDAFTYAELAAELSRQTGSTIPYTHLTVEQFKARLVESGMAEAAAERRANVDRAMAEGQYHITTGDLRRLAGRPLTTLAEAVAAALA